MDSATQERIRSYLAKARREVGFVKQHPNYCCDVCGPDGRHTFHACSEASATAIKAFLLFHGREPEQTAVKSLVGLVGAEICLPMAGGTWDRLLNSLVTLAAAEVSTIVACIELIVAAKHYGGRLQKNTPETAQVEAGEAVRLAEEFVTLVGSKLPEDVQR